MRHLAVGHLWIQEKVCHGEFLLTNVAGTDNPADILTKPVGRTLLEQHIPAIGLQWECGRSALAPKVEGATDRVPGGAAARGERSKEQEAEGEEEAQRTEDEQELDETGYEIGCSRPQQTQEQQPVQHHTTSAHHSAV